MRVYSGKELSAVVRSACDEIKSRLWIASPYVGGWQNVRCVLGRQWWDNKRVDVRLLTDEETRPNGDTLQRFEQKGPIHHLRGLHAKIYVFDNKVLLTSANLTGAAFTQRHEAGALLTGAAAVAAIEVFTHWWTSLSKPISSAKLERLRRNKRDDDGEDSNGGLPLLNPPPDDPGDFGGHKLTGRFVDYPRFLENYRTLAKEYESIQRIWPNVPLYFEVDGFLNYLFRVHEKHPSKPFEKRSPRQLTAAARHREMKVLANSFRDSAKESGEDGLWLLKHSVFVRRSLRLSHIGRIHKAEIRGVIEGLQCMRDGRFRKRFLDENSTPAIRSAWRDLLHGSGPLPERMSICASLLFGFKRSSVQELLGFFKPEEYPLRNATVNAGLRFFGFDVSAH